MVIVAGVRNRRNIRTSASVTFVFLSAAMRRTGMPGWEMPMASGCRDGLACAKTKSSRRLRVSPRKDNCCRSSGMFTCPSIGRPVSTRVEIFCVLCMFFNEATTECASYKVWKENDFNGFRRNSPVGSVGSIFVGALHCFVNHKKDGMPVVASRELKSSQQRSSCHYVGFHTA